MMLLWIIMILLHHGLFLDAQLSVIRRQLGEPVTFTCQFTELEQSNTKVKWYKQSFGDTLRLIATVMKASSDPIFEQGFLPSRFGANSTKVTSTLTILTTIQEDEALYHCAVTTWSQDQWTGTYLSFKENTQRASDYTVVQWPAVSDLVHTGDTVTLQCSIFSSSASEPCPDEHNVHWFGVGLDKSIANIIYTNGIGSHKCEKKAEASPAPKSCVYQFSKNITSLDTGTYYCALAMCGEMILGNGTKLEIKGSLVSLKDHVILLLLCAVSALSVIVIAVLIYTIKNNKCDCNVAISLQENVAKRNLKREEDMYIYSAVVFTMIKTDGGSGDTRVVGRERIYAAVKAFGVD